MSSSGKNRAGRARIRLVSVVIHPSVVVDDGEALTELPIDPIKVAASDWPRVVEMLEAARQQLEAQVNDGRCDPSPGEPNVGQN